MLYTVACSEWVSEWVSEYKWVSMSWVVWVSKQSCEDSWTSHNINKHTCFEDCLTRRHTQLGPHTRKEYEGKELERWDLTRSSPFLSFSLSLFKVYPICLRATYTRFQIANEIIDSCGEDNFWWWQDCLESSKTLPCQHPVKLHSSNSLSISRSSIHWIAYWKITIWLPTQTIDSRS